MYYDDFYNEPSESDIYIEELKDKIRLEVKKDIINELERLRKENKELQDVKNNINKLEREYNQKKNELEREYQEKERTLMQRPLNELLEIIKEEYYCIDRPYDYIPKCDKCNEKRKLEFTDVYGRKHEVKCVCDKMERKPFEVETKYIGTIKEISKRNGKMCIWTSFTWSKSNYEPYEYISGTYFDKECIVYNYEQLEVKIADKSKKEIIENIYRKYYFVNKKDAEKFAKWLNNALEEQEV